MWKVKKSWDFCPSDDSVATLVVTGEQTLRNLPPFHSRSFSGQHQSDANISDVRWWFIKILEVIEVQHTRDKCVCVCEIIISLHMWQTVSSCNQCLELIGYHASIGLTLSTWHAIHFKLQNSILGVCRFFVTPPVESHGSQHSVYTWSKTWTFEKTTEKLIK